jgi:hypothetical protein
MLEQLKVGAVKTDEMLARSRRVLDASLAALRDVPPLRWRRRTDS